MMKPYNRLNPIHWVVAFFSNSRKSDYLKDGTLHVAERKYKATQRIMYWFRNPMHDFTHYIIGFDGEPGWALIKGYRLGEQTGLSAALFRYGPVPFPWIHYMGHGVQIEFGWNDSGNLKIKLRRKK